MKRAPLLISFILFLALCASAAYWVLQFIQPPKRAMVAPPSSTQTAPDIAAAADLLGGKSHATLTSNFQLTGIIGTDHPAESIAIIATNGTAAKPYRLHAELQAGVTVQEIQRDYVLLSDHGASKRLDLANNPNSQLKVIVPLQNLASESLKQPASNPSPTIQTTPQPLSSEGANNVTVQHTNNFHTPFLKH